MCDTLDNKTQNREMYVIDALWDPVWVAEGFRAFSLRNDPELSNPWKDVHYDKGPDKLLLKN